MCITSIAARQSEIASRRDTPPHSLCQWPRPTSTAADTRRWRGETAENATEYWAEWWQRVTVRPSFTSSSEHRRFCCWRRIARIPKFRRRRDGSAASRKFFLGGMLPSSVFISKAVREECRHPFSSHPVSTSSCAVAKRPLDASCLSVVSTVQHIERSHLLLVT